MPAPWFLFFLGFALALALGFVLIGLSIGVNLLIHSLSRTEREGRW